MHLPFLFSALACTVAFAWMVSFGTFQLVTRDVFGLFYDYQAAAWLKGRWDVPEVAISGEAFIVEGKIYGYFGPTPALMRLPLVLLGIGFGSVTRLFMLIDYVAWLTGAYAILRLATRWRAADAEPRPMAVVLFIATAGLGSMVFFLASRAYVYHEAILCGATFAVWASYFAFRHLQTPATRWWVASLACGVLAVQSRAPIGLFALSLLACVACAHAMRERRVGPLLVVALSGLGVFSFNAVSWLKFRTFEGCPLRYNVQYPPERLVDVGERNFHLSNLRFNADVYLLRPGFALRHEFPFVYRDFVDRREYPESRLVYRDATVAMPWSMPALFMLAVGGSALGAGSLPGFRRPLAVLWIAVLPASLAMLTAIAVTQRYEADFCPFLVAASAFGIATLEGFSDRARRVAWWGLAPLAVVGILVTLAFTLHNQRDVVWGVPDDVRKEYQQFRTRVDAFFHPQQRN